MLKLRLATALVLAPAVLAGVVFLPNDLFAVFVFLLGAFGLYEWAGLAGIANAAHRIAYAVLAGLCMYALWVQSEWRMAMLVATAALWLFACLFVVLMAAGRIGRRGSSEGDGDRAQLALMAPGGILVFTGAWLGLVLLHASEDGYRLIIWAFVLAWSVDTGAYIVGRAWGRTRLAPRVSPGKTWEGVAGGMCAGLAAGCGLAWALDLGSLAEWAVVAVALSVVAVFGDLFESAIKRASGAKDSGTLLPGHGGVLDRIDSTIAVVPVFALWAAVMM